MHGQIEMRGWRDFRATEFIDVGDQFRWSARSRLAGLPIAGYDRYATGEGEMRWRLAGILPVMSARGRDVTRSAAARLAGESVFVPTSLVDAFWIPVASNSAAFVLDIAGRRQQVTVEVSAEGALKAVRLVRWGNPDATKFRECLFEVTVEHESTFDDITVPGSFRAAWSWDSPSAEFFRAEVDNAQFGTLVPCRPGKTALLCD
jgi:hypothetical protein